MRFSAKSKLGVLAFWETHIGDIGQRRVWNFGKRGSSAFNTANMTLNFRNASSLAIRKRLLLL